jgi:hypothetical protein
VSQLQRPQLEAILRQGGSVLLPGGRHITTLEELPPESVLAQGDQTREDQALAALDAQILSIQGQKDAILRARAEREAAAGGMGARPPQAGQAPPPPPGPPPPAQAAAPPAEEGEGDGGQVVRREGFRFDAPAEGGDEGRRAGRKR